MSSNWKDELDRLPIPSDLHEHALRGIGQAAGEDAPRRLRFPAGRPWLAAALLALIVLTMAMFNTQVWAAIHKALQYVPGIGMLREEEAPVSRYVLKDPITKIVGKGKLTVTGVMVDSEMTYITMNGTNVPRPDQVTLTDGQGTAFIIPHSQAIWGGNEWRSSFYFKGALELNGKAELMIGASPNDIVIPLSLVGAESFANYSDMGETAEVNGAAITAIATRDGEKAKISLVSPTSKDFTVNDYGINGIYERENQKLMVTDGTGEKLAIESIPVLTAPAREFYFPLTAAGQSGSYTLTLPEIDVRYQDELTIRIPAKSTEKLNQTFEIAGFPVTITRTEKIGSNQLRLDMDFHYDEHAPRSLLSFRMDGSGGSKINEQNGTFENFQVEIHPGQTQTTLKIHDPQVVIRGPWSFTFPASVYFPDDLSSFGE